MDFQNKRLVFEGARPDDSREILEILEENDFKGNICLVYTRRPDAYSSFMREGSEVSIVVCRDTLKGKIAGIGALAYRRHYINGKEETVGYLFGLRVKNEYRKTFPIISRGYKFLEAGVKEKGVRYVYTTILEENVYAQKLLEKKRVSIPSYEFFTKYSVYSFKVNMKWRNASGNGVVFRQADVQDVPGIVSFLNREGSRNQLYPRVSELLLMGDEIPGLSYKDFYVVCNKEHVIVACGGAWDQNAYKQYILKQYGGPLKFLYPFSFLLNILGYPALPEPGSTLKFFTLSFWAVKEGEPELFRILLNGISKSRGDYKFFSVGVCDISPLKDVLEEVRHIKYTSKVYFVNWNKAEPVADKLESGLMPYMECGLL